MLTRLSISSSTFYKLLQAAEERAEAAERGEPPPERKSRRRGGGKVPVASSASARALYAAGASITDIATRFNISVSRAQEYVLGEAGVPPELTEPAAAVAEVERLLNDQSS
jgi:hypothetical protein